MKKTLKFTFRYSLIAALLSVSTILIWNNAPIGHSEQQRILQAYEQSVDWLASREDLIESYRHPMLWFYLKQAYKLNGDPELGNLINRHFEKNRKTYQSTIWASLLFDDSDFRIAIDMTIDSVPYYNLPMLYGSTCNAELADIPAVREQLEPGYCWRPEYFSPACHTHQAMAISLIMSNGCPGEEDAAQTFKKVLNDIYLQAMVDPRVIDVYLQRVLVLVESEGLASVKKRWITRILDAQLADGGWADFQPILPLGEGRYFGVGSNRIFTTTPSSSPHATFQGIYLLALLSQDSR